MKTRMGLLSEEDSPAMFFGELTDEVRSSPVEIIYSTTSVFIGSDRDTGSLLLGYSVERGVVNREGRHGYIDRIKHGFYNSAKKVHKQAYALCKEEHRELGWPEGDERIRYPFRDSENG